uniref:Uncharacterized protein n=1 Tax=Siphoviridae sp. ctxMM9 TaxID=2827973 RepID=A0A8S5T5V3_9CAUD|nr:MAG TPA: hypothetical protein [Siphoviridae sp. ctxMM9]
MIVEDVISCHTVDQKCINLVKELFVDLKIYRFHVSYFLS